MIAAVRRGELSRIAVVLIPRLLAGIERARGGVGLHPQVIDRVDHLRASTYAEHDCVLI